MVEWDLPEGKKEVQFNERRYFPTELKEMFQDVGLLVENIWGGTAGKWGRRNINLDEIEVMVLARKGIFQKGLLITQQSLLKYKIAYEINAKMFENFVKSITE